MSECSFVFKPTFGESALGTTSLFSTREVKESDQTSRRGRIVAIEATETLT